MINQGQISRDGKKYIGEYNFTIYDQQVENVRVHKKNGYLYFENLKLEEHKPGLVFSSTGEALNLGGKIPTWRNIKLRKKIQ